MDFASMFSNINMGDRYARTNPVDDTAVYRERQLARADNEGRRAEEEAARDRSVFAEARTEIDAGVDGPALTAYMYPSAIAEIKNLIRGGHLDKANSRVQSLKQSADEHASVYRTYESSRASDNKFEAAVNNGGHAMAHYSFWDESVSMADGTTTTIGDLFRDGEAFKVFRQDSFLKTGMSEDFFEAYKEADPFKKRVFSMVADPVATGTAGERLPQYSDVGNYLTREWDSMVQELGQNGTQRLVQDVVAKRIADGTAIDVLNSVRDFVYAQVNGEGANQDGDILVRQYLGAYDRLAALSPKDKNGDTSWQVKMTLAKMLSSIAEGQRVGATNVNLDDPVTLHRITDAMGVFAEAEARGISLLEEGNEGGTNMRAALSDYVTGHTESNYVRRVRNMFSLSDNLIGAAGQPSSAVVANVMQGVRDELTHACVKLMSTGAREDVAVQSIFADDARKQELVSRWADVIASNGGFSTQTAAYVAAKIMGSMSYEGSVQPVDVQDILLTSSFEHDCPASVKSELRRWYKGSNMINSLMDKKYKTDFLAMKTDRIIGDAMTDAQAQGAWAKLCSDIVPYLATGRDPDVAMDMVLNSAPVYRPSGTAILPGGVIIPEDALPRLYDIVRRSPTGTADYPLGGQDVQITRDMLEAAIPGVEYSGATEYLPGVRLEASHMLGITKGLEPGAWTDSTGRTAFLRYQAMLKQAYEAARSARMKAAIAADKRVATAEASSDEIK